MPASPDWAERLDRLVEGDRLAYVEWSQRVAGWLAGWRAYDFRSEWDDLVQEILIAAIESARDGRIQERAATLAYVRQIARNKYNQRLTRHLGRGEGQSLPWEDVCETLASEDDARGGTALRTELGQALQRLEPPRGELVIAVYGHKRTVPQAAADLGVPLGSAKRYLRQGLAQLRRDFGGPDGDSRDDPEEEGEKLAAT